MDTVQTSTTELADQISTLQEQAAESEHLAKEIKADHQRLLSWAEMFDSASPPEKKMVASYLIKAVTLSRDYGINSRVQYLRSAVSRWAGNGMSKLC